MQGAAVLGHLGTAQPKPAPLHISTLPHRTLRWEAARCEAARGFGDSAPQPPKQSSKGSKARNKPKKRVESISPGQAVDRAVRIAEGGATRPVNSDEAAKGRLDYVQVKDWGTGKRADLGSLEVDRITTVSGDPLAGESDRPFYEQLARHLEICQARGDLNPPAGTKPLPPFEKWSFKKRHFLQYLTDLLHVHYALEGATIAALQPNRDDLPQDGDPDMDSIESYVDPSKLTGAYDTRPCHVLGCFTEGSGLPRAGAIAEDMQTIARHSSGNLPLELTPSKHAEQYADNLAVTGGVAQDEEQGEAKQDEARLRLFANIYSNQVAHLTTGMRIGAAAAERLDLLSIGATNMYQTYPEEMGDPLHVFMGLVNGIGAKLSAQEKSIVFEELPGAFYRSSQLLSALARTD